MVVSVDEAVVIEEEVVLAVEAVVTEAEEASVEEAEGIEAEVVSAEVCYCVNLSFYQPANLITRRWAWRTKRPWRR